MTIASELEQLQTNLENAYNAIEAKGGEIPSVRSFNNLSTSVETISGGGSQGEYLVRVIDYDGTILKEEYLDTGDTFTLPENPTNRPNLTFQEWSCPVDITNNTITVENFDIFIGAVYEPTSGLDEFDITLDSSTGLSVSLGKYGNNETIDWGDGTINDSSSHTYSSYGNYTIKSNSIVYDFNSAKNSLKNIRFAPLHFGEGWSYFNSLESRDYYNVETITIPKELSNNTIDWDISAFDKLKCLIIPNNCTNLYIKENWNLDTLVIGKGDNIVIKNCLANFNMKNFTLPQGLTSVGGSGFYYCHNWNSKIYLPSTLTSIVQSTFRDCSSLSRINIPNTLQTYPTSSAFINGCYALDTLDIGIATFSSTTINLSNSYLLKNITLGSNVTTIPASMFRYQKSLEKIKIPASVTTIGARAFENCWSLFEIDFTHHQSVPTLSNSNAFTNISTGCKILVPSALEDDWKAATNWSVYADRIYGV